MNSNTTNSDKCAELIARRNAALPRGVGQAHPLFVDHTKNAELWDVDGHRYIDFCAGIAVVNSGHCNPKVVKAVSTQLNNYLHTCFQVVAYEPYLCLVEKLNQIVPGTSPKKSFLMNTGAEAVENAIKIARAATGRSGIIAFNGGFHGRTMMGLALTGKVDPYKKSFGPYPAEIYHAPFPCKLHDISIDQSIAGIEQIFKSDIDPQRVAAIIVEPVQGEGGYYAAPNEFLQRLRTLCNQQGILLIADEVQTGIGRTGRLFAMEHSGVEADITTLAKGLGGGLPISAIVGRAEIMDAASPGGLGGTYSGNPLSCASALAVLELMQEQNLPARSARLGERLQNRLRVLAKNYDCIADIRGLGLMVAIELYRDGKPSAELTKALVTEARQRGLLLLACGNYGNVIRFMTPLTIEDEVLDEGLKLLGQAFAALDG